MRILTVCLPTLMVVSLTVVLATQNPARAVAGDLSSREAERLRLEQERKTITDRLEQVEAQRHHVLPRGGL